MRSILVLIFRRTKEVEWWNEITPWKNSESKRCNRVFIKHIGLYLDFYMKMSEEYQEEGIDLFSIVFLHSNRIFPDTDYTDEMVKNEDSMDSDYDTTRKRRVRILSLLHPTISSL